MSPPRPAYGCSPRAASHPQLSSHSSPPQRHQQQQQQSPQQQQPQHQSPQHQQHQQSPQQHQHQPQPPVPMPVPILSRDSPGGLGGVFEQGAGSSNARSDDDAAEAMIEVGTRGSGGEGVGGLGVLNLQREVRNKQGLHGVSRSRVGVSPAPESGVSDCSWGKREGGESRASNEIGGSEGYV